MQQHETLNLRSVCQKNGLPVEDRQLLLIGSYVEMLLGWNQKINLISRRDEENVWTSHILHSISPLFKVSFPTGSRIIDLGTGGGLPGIPLAILLPDCEFLLVDATQKKANAVAEMIGELKLTNARAIWGRGEELSGKAGLENSFDIVISRAVGPLDQLTKYGERFLRRQSTSKTMGAEANSRRPAMLRGPCLIAYKGGDTEREIEATKRRSDVEEIREILLTFVGSAESGLVDKKIVLVHLKR